MNFIISENGVDINKLIKIGLHHENFHVLSSIDEYLHSHKEQLLTALIVSWNGSIGNILNSGIEYLRPGGLLLIRFDSNHMLERIRKQYWNIFSHNKLKASYYIKKTKKGYYLYLRKIKLRESKPASKKNTSVSVQFYEDHKIAEKTLKYIDKFSDPDVNIIVLDNGCDTETADLIKSYALKWGESNQFRSVKYIKMHKNNGVVSARNAIIKECKTQYLIRLFGDIIVPNNYIDNFIEAINSSANFHFVGARENISCLPNQHEYKDSYFIDDSDLINDLGVDEYMLINSKYNENSSKLFISLTNKRVVNDYCCDHAHILDTDAFKIIGDYDSHFFPHFYSVTDYHWRLYTNGLMSCNTDLVTIIHNPIEAGNINPRDNKYYWSSKKYFDAKYHIITPKYKIMQKIKNRLFGIDNYRDNLEMMLPDPAFYKADKSIDYDINMF